MHNNTYLIIGASGYIGSYFIKNILDKTKCNIIATHNSSPSITDARVKWHKLDIANFQEVDSFCDELKKTDSKLKVIYLAAFHHPDKVEENPKFAWNINITALANLINKIPNIYTLYYSSTDTVYGESLDNHHFKEDEIHNPVNEYGKQKSLAEKIVLSCGYNVIHYPFLIGPSLTNKKHFYDVIVEDLKNGKKVEAFYDSCRSSLDFNSSTVYAIDLIEKYGNKILGIINICSDKPLSKYDVILDIAKKINCDEKNIIPISINSGNVIFKAKRPQNTLMNNELIKELLNLKKIKINI